MPRLTRPDRAFFGKDTVTNERRRLRVVRESAASTRDGSWSVRRSAQPRGVHARGVHPRTIFIEIRSERYASAIRIEIHLKLRKRWPCVAWRRALAISAHVEGPVGSADKRREEHWQRNILEPKMLHWSKERKRRIHRELACPIFVAVRMHCHAVTRCCRRKVWGRWGCWGLGWRRRWRR